MRQGFSIDHLTDLLRSNPRYIFTCNPIARKRKTSRHEANKITYEWRHKKYEGSIKVRKSHGIFWAEVKSDQGSQLLGAFISWLFSNAGEMVYRADIRQG
jgi:hypothetical protein